MRGDGVVRPEKPAPIGSRLRLEKHKPESSRDKTLPDRENKCSQSKEENIAQVARPGASVQWAWSNASSLLFLSRLMGWGVMRTKKEQLQRPISQIHNSLPSKKEDT